MKEHRERSSAAGSGRKISPDGYRLGIDIGSTTVKLVATDPATGKILYSHYERHNARQTETLIRLLTELAQLYPLERFLTAVCGSGGRTVAERLDVHFIQEVVANSAAVRELYPRAGRTSRSRPSMRSRSRRSAGSRRGWS